VVKFIKQNLFFKVIEEVIQRVKYEAVLIKKLVESGKEYVKQKVAIRGIIKEGELEGRMKRIIGHIRKPKIFSEYKNPEDEKTYRVMLKVLKSTGKYEYKDIKSILKDMESAQEDGKNRTIEGELIKSNPCILNVNSVYHR
jgi:hypothetical protein|tara:strand:+ start:563 stop:985 length:423 start_codon:yes stop_codon:yes gene_type:complete